MLRRPVYSRLIFSLAMASAAWAGTFGTVVPIGGQAADLALDETRGVLYVANFTANRVDVISLANNAVQTSMNVAPQPSSIALSPDGHYLLVAHFGNYSSPAPSSNALTLIDLTTTGKQTFALGNPPLGVAFGADGKALVVTTADYQLFDPATGTSQQLDTISKVVAKTLPVPPNNFPPQITTASIVASADGSAIFGMGGSSATFTFRYDTATHSVRPGGIVTSSGTFGPRIVSMSPNGDWVMAGWVLLNRNGFFTHLLPSANQLNVGATAFDVSRNLLYAQIPETAGEAPVLKVLDFDSFATREKLQLAENLGGKSILSSDTNTLYAVSDSGVTVLPVGSLSKTPRLAASQQDLVFRGSFCDRRAATQEFTVYDPGNPDRNVPFSVVSLLPGVTVTPSSGTAPATVRVTVDPNAFQSQKGTSSGTLQITSPVAANVVQKVRVLVNTREPDQRGTFVNVPGKLVDLLADPVRERFYVLRQDTNQVLVYDGANDTQIAALKTGNVPAGMAATLDGHYLLVANSMSQFVSVIDLDKLQSVDPVYTQNFTTHSVAVSGNAILAAAVDFEGKGRVIRLDMDRHVAAKLPALGVFTNDINPNSALAATPNGSAILLVQADGNVMLYDANADSFTVSRKDVAALSGAYAASSYGQFMAGNALLNSSLVPVKQLDTSLGASSGFAFSDSIAFRTTAPSDVSSASSTTSAASAAPSTSATAQQVTAGVIQRLDVSDPASLPSRATRIVEAPLTGSSTLAFTRTIVPLASHATLINLTTSGFTVLPWEFDASVAPPRIQSVVNAADQGPNVAAGSLVSIFGQQFSPVNLATSELPIPTALGDSCLTVNGTPIPMLFVSPNQINAQLPNEATGNVTMILRTPGGISDNYNLVIKPNAPGVFRASGSGLNAPVPTVVREKNNELVTASNPVHRNDSLTIYLTGLGPTNPPVASGQPAPSNPLAVTIQQPSVTLGGTPLPVSFSGLAPGLVGVYQINVRVPSSVPAGMSIPLMISQPGGSTSVPVRVVD